MIGLRVQCYIPSFKAIGLLVSQEKIFEEVLSYMFMTAILAMRPGPFEQTFVSPSHRGSVCVLASIGPVANNSFSIQT